MDFTPEGFRPPCRIERRPVAPHSTYRCRHASDRMLALMRVRYTCDAYRPARDRQLHGASPQRIRIGSDISWGSGGDRGRLERNLELLARLTAVDLHVFPYSDRPGTVASALKGRLKVSPSASAAASFAPDRRRA